MTFKEYLNEGFISIQDIKDDSDLLRLAIQAELDASNLYNILSRKTSNNNIRTVLQDIRKEEHVHIGEFEKLLREINSEYKTSTTEGETEVDDILNGRKQ